MGYIRDILRSKLLLHEVRVIDPNLDLTHQGRPLKDSNTIKVYHGFNDYNDAVAAVRYGLSGKDVVGRDYSYESNNNPTGLFISIDFKTAKKFVKPKSNGYGVIMELNVKYGDLEAPVWPGGSYTVPGQVSKNWRDSVDRYNNGIIKSRELALNSDYSFIKKSDRPEVAMSIMGSENQALFTGDLSPNMINSLWIIEPNGKTIKLTRKQFYNNFAQYDPENYVKNDTKKRNYQKQKDRNEIFKADEDFSEIKLKEYLNNEGYNLSPIDFINLMFKEGLINDFFWPKQVEQIKDYIKN